MSDFKTIGYQVNNGVACITLQRSESMNAISQAMRQELLAAIDNAEKDAAVRTVVINGDGKGFSSGTDLSEGMAGYDTIEEQILEEYKPVLVGIESSSKLYIASVHGACVGIGAALALACDLVIMADSAFLYIAFAGLGLVPDGGISYHLVHAMGYKKAVQLFAESGKLTADECERYGLANKVVSAEDLTDATTQWAETLASGAPIAHKYGKAIMRSVHGSTYSDIVNQEAKWQNDCCSSQDSKNAIQAFFEKKKPVFIGS